MDSWLIRACFHVEIYLTESSTAKKQDVKDRVAKVLIGRELFVKIGEPTTIDYPIDDPFFSQNIKSISLHFEPKHEVSPMLTAAFSPQNLPNMYVYQLNEDEASEEIENDTPACHQWILPNKAFQGLWETLIFDEDIKINLLDYVSTTMLFSDKHVDSNIISWNRVVLLHGPPGTGKTTLCKALSQKLSIRLSDRFAHGQLVEINSHSLFSKWFSESGKLVMKMFSKIRELADEEDSFVCVLIDEVESLTAARKSAMSGSEPSDAIRVVNALLTQIDQLKTKSNVIVLTTSNITGAIDLAFVDRADIKQYIGPPSVAARYHILSSCIMELMRVGIISPMQSLLDFKALELLNQENDATRLSLALLETSKACEGSSGRFLRKLPFLAHAFYLKTVCNLEQFILALNKTIEKEYKGRAKIESN